MFDILQLPFMQRAIIGGIVVALIGAILGTFITLKKQSFITDGIAHASLAGIAIGLVVAVNPLLPALVVAIFMSLLITFLNKKVGISADVLIGTLYSVFFALGVIIVNLTPGFQPELFSFLFGSILSITKMDLIVSILLSLVVIGVVYRNYRQLVYSTFDSEAAFIRGVKVQKLEYLLNVLSAVAIVVAIKLVGVILVTALFIIPPAVARMFATRFKQMLPLSTAIAVTGTLLGIFLAYIIDVPVGATIVVVLGIIFAIGFSSNRI